MNVNINLGNQFVSQQNPSVSTSGEVLNPQQGQTGQISLADAKVGTMFLGDILDVRAGQVRIQVGNTIISALLENGANVNIGERLSFLVKEQLGTKILLKPLAQDGVQMQNALVKALQDASLPVTPRNMEAVKQMMNHQMPIDKNTLADMGKILTQFQDANAETIIGLKSHGLDVTETNITQFEAYQNGSQKLSDSFKTFMGELTAMAEGAGDLKALGKVTDFLTQIQHLLGNEEGTFQVKTAAAGTNGAASIADENVNVKPSADMAMSEKQGKDSRMNANSDTGSKVNANPNIDSRVNVSPNTDSRVDGSPNTDRQMPLAEGKNIAGAMGEEKSPEVPIAEEKERVQTLLKQIENGFEKKFLLTPQQLSEEGGQAVKELYHKLWETTEKLMQVLEQNGQEHSKLMDTAGGMKNNMSFMQDFNQMAAYVQLPMKLNGGEQTGELYVLNRRRNKSSNEEALTAFLHLDMDSLGATDVSLSMFHGKLTTKFTLDNDASIRIVEEHLPELKKRLDELGYQAEITVEELEGEAQTPFSRILEADKPKQTVKRFNFDVRA